MNTKQTPAINPQIRQENVDVFQDHIGGLPCDPKHSFLINRVLRALRHFKSLVVEYRPTPYHLAGNRARLFGEIVITRWLPHCNIPGWGEGRAE